MGHGRTLIGVRWDRSGYEKEMDFFVKSTGASVFTIATDEVTLGEDEAGIDWTLYGDTASAFWQWDASADDMILSGAASIQTAQTGTGYSLNLISVTSTTGSGNTRGWRVNVTTSASITHGDLQCIHGYLTTGANVTLATNAAIYPLSAWLDLPATVTPGSGNLIAGLRVIVDPNGEDLSALAGGGESAMIYAQTWADQNGSLEHGLRIVNGGGSGSIKNLISLACTGTASYTNAFDMTETPDGFQTLFSLGLTDSQSRHVLIYQGDQATSAGIFGEVSVVAGLGSLYISTVGKLFVRINNAGAAADWQGCDTTEI